MGDIQGNKESKKPNKGISVNKAEVKKRTQSSRPQGNSSRPQGNGSRPQGNGSRPQGSRSRQQELRRQQARKKRKRRNFIIALIPALVVGILFAVITSSIIKGRFLKVTKTNREYALGTKFDINNYVETVDKEAYLELLDNSEIPKEIGTYEVRYRVVKGKLRKKKKVKISVIDTDRPFIDGPDELVLQVGDECDYSKYYTVSDSEPELEKKIKANIEVDTSTTGIYEVTLMVTDWSDNSGTKNVTVRICDTKE